MLKFDIEETEIECTLSDIVSDEQITLRFYTENVMVDYVTLYFACDDLGTFYSSSLSFDTAKHNAGEILNYDLVEENDCFTSGKIDGASPFSVGVTGSVSGTFRWTDDQGNTHPLIGAKVEITIDGSWWNDTTYTDQAGFYSFS